MAVVIEYPKYDEFGQDKSYLLRAQAAGVHPLFLTILSLRENCLSRFDKNAFIEIYCTAYTESMRQLRGSHDTRYPDLPTSRAVTYVPPYDPNEPTQYNQFPFGKQQSNIVVGESGPPQEYQYGKVNDDRDPSDDELGGGKSRRISNRKSRRKSSRKNRNFK